MIHNAFGDAKETSATAALSMNDLWKHCLATGMAMEIIGKAVFKFRFADHYAKVPDLVESENISICSASRTPTAAVSWLSTGTCPAKFVPPSPRTTSPASLPSTDDWLPWCISDIAVRTMGIGCGGDPLIPQTDPYAARLQRSVEEIVQNKGDFIQQCDSILGA